MLHSSKSNSFNAARFCAVAVLAFFICRVWPAAAMSAQPSSENNTTAGTPLILSGRSAHGTHSAGIDEIIQMLDAQLDHQVIMAYIQKSAIPYNPDAAELIMLKEHGAPSELLVALLHRGQELNTRIAQAQSQRAASAPAAPVPANPVVPIAAPEYAPAQPVPAYPDTYPVYSYGYPVAYSTVGYWWPGAYGCFYNGCWHYGCGGYRGGCYGYWRGAGCQPVCRTWNQSFHFNSAAGHSFTISASGHTSASLAHSGGGHAAMAMHSAGHGRGR